MGPRRVWGTSDLARILGAAVLHSNDNALESRVRVSLWVVRRPTRLNSKMKLDLRAREQSSAHTVSPRQRHAFEAFNLSEGRVQNSDGSKCI